MSKALPTTNEQRQEPNCWNQIGVAGDRSCPELSVHVHCRNCAVYSRGATRLLERQLPPDHLATWTSHFAAPRSFDASERSSLFVFRLGAEWHALPTHVLEQVVELRPVHSLPQRLDGIVLGVVNVRGGLLVCVSLKRVLGAESPALESTTEDRRRVHARMLVLGREASRFVVPVDEVHGTHKVRQSELVPPPPTLRKAPVTFTSAAFSWEDHWVGCLDDALLFRALERSLS